ncbi:hypothetical protein PAAG_12273 [Paracoccidioides lutzii Pb01]|uniref:Uncharacterized protein n=1 Tax=Paracoccidioides lutzii (strain ATCC MYA-826 / Pb01) TaxID=502779 RepID=A0A0A2V3R8_PARBA|nr:hypothetical protein PAAG_12273 [Paracoccidioides lutzii Pb01]KGQ01022.1 hypothetical protein PAAG_12273 [Paracoccidioides lutzii Pb01]
MPWEVKHRAVFLLLSTLKSHEVSVGDVLLYVALAGGDSTIRDYTHSNRPAATTKRYQYRYRADWGSRPPWQNPSTISEMGLRSQTQSAGAGDLNPTENILVFYGCTSLFELS